MDPTKLASVMNTSTARCWSSDSYNPVPGVMLNVPASRGYSGGFGATLMEKDLNLALNLGNAIKARLPLGSNAQQLYGILCEQGLGDKDFSVIYEFLMKSAPKDSF
jgi:3-hydroxyisobutyrate dehydrogenase